MTHSNTAHSNRESLTVPAPASLPEIYTSPELGEAVGRSPRNVADMSSRGILPDPGYSYRGKPAWVKTAALAWFTTLHDHSVIVPANDLAFAELRSYGIYMCPMSSDHVGLARPEMLVMYESGGSGSGRAFTVTAVETVNQQLVNGTRPTSPQTNQIVRDGTAIGTSGEMWTVFFLSEAGTIANIKPVIQQGRYVPTADVRQAMTSHMLSVPTLDTAFPKRW